MPSISFTPYLISPDGDAATVLAYRYDPSADAGERFELLNWIRCLEITYQDGPNPPTARFEYVFDDADPLSPWPRQFEEVWPLDSTSPYTVHVDDRIVVKAFDGGDEYIIFDGFALSPQVDLDSENQGVTFGAVGVAVRLWDLVITGRTQRHSNTPNSEEVDDVAAIDAPCHFNPASGTGGKYKIVPNCSPEGHDVHQGDEEAYPVFYEPSPEWWAEPDEWTLRRLALYLFRVHNDTEEWVKNPPASYVETLLDSYRGVFGPFWNPTTPSTYETTPIVVRDIDGTNKAWPDVLYEAIAPHGFSFVFAVETDESGEPVNRLLIYRKDTKTNYEPKELFLQSLGADINPGESNVGGLHVSRDGQPVANEWTVEAPVLYEISVILAPGFEPEVGDEDEANRINWRRANLTNATAEKRNKYRLYVADEAGSGHWDHETETMDADPLDLSSIFPDDDFGFRTYVTRLRPCGGSLLSRDAIGEPYKAQLAFSRDYVYIGPELWHANSVTGLGTGHWQPIPHGSWSLLNDRIGIMFTCDDPEAIPLGKFADGADKQNPGDALRGVKSQANPDVAEQLTQRFFLRLTTVIEGDRSIEATATKRESSPSRFTIERRVDASDHFRQEIVTATSLHNDTVDLVILRDDSDKALAYAEAMRTANENPPLVGQVVVPSFTSAYGVGDRISVIRGRDVSLRTNVGAGQGEAPDYPWIEAIVYEFGSERQSTTITLSDKRSGPGRV